MQTEYSHLQVVRDHNDNLKHLHFEDRVEEPPYVYMGSKHPAEIATVLPGDVYNFEQAWKNAKPVRIYDLVGNPVYPHEKDIDDSSIETELALIINLMQKNNISITIPADKSARDGYRFITEFVFEQEVHDLKLGGLGRNFFYGDNIA